MNFHSPPRSIPFLLLKKLFIISPRREPIASNITDNSVCGLTHGTNPEHSANIWKRPTIIPAETPRINPLIVFPSPNIRLPSLHFFPRSMGVPPPVSAAILFGRYAGSITHIAEPIRTARLVTNEEEFSIPIRLGFCIHMSRR